VAGSWIYEHRAAIERHMDRLDEYLAATADSPDCGP